MRQLGVPFALAYLLAGWFAAALHSHGAHAHDVEAAATCSCGHHHCVPHHDGVPGHADQTDGSPTPEHDEHHCVACDYLAKPPLPVVALELEQVAERVAPAAEPSAPLSKSHVPLTWRSRGPPLV